VGSQQAFARSCAPCPPYVEQLSRGRLAPTARKRCGKCQAEEGLKVLWLVLKYDHQVSNQSWTEEQEEQKEVGRFTVGA